MKASLLGAIGLCVFASSCSKQAQRGLDPMYAEASDDILDANGQVIGHRDWGGPDPYRPPAWEAPGAGVRARSLLERIDPSWIAARRENRNRTPQPVVIPPHPPVVTRTKPVKSTKPAFLEQMINTVPNKTDKDLDNQ